MTLNAHDAGCLSHTASSCLNRRTYRNNHHGQRISFDVASLVRGHNPENATLRKLSGITADANTDANIPLPLEANEQIATSLDVVSLELKYRRLAGCVREE